MRLLIDDPDDPRLAPYKDVKERDLVGRQGLFMAEGEVVLRQLVRSPTCEAVSVLIAEKREAALSSILDELPEATPVYLAPQAVMDAVAGFPMHRGILALGRRRTNPALSDILAAAGPRSLVLVLVGISNHDNMGGLFRNAAAFGASAVLIDPTSCDPLYRKAIRVSVGAALKVPFVRLDEEADWAGALEAAGFVIHALSPSGESRLGSLAPSPRAALVMGAEGPGLPRALLEKFHSVRIEMAEDFDSLNVSVAAGLALHHMAFGAAKIA
jgi:tRNA G18 (ribose-2'-O)-methylase SpoU